MKTLSCRNMPAPEAAKFMVEQFNGLAPGEKLEAEITDYDPGLRMWFLEAGLRHRPTRTEDGAWHIVVERGISPALGTVPGVHHLVTADDGTLWACKRGPKVARIAAGTREPELVRDAMTSGSHIAIDARAQRIVVADPRANELVALRAGDLAVEQRWKSPGGPELPVISPDGIVCVTGGATGTLTIVRPQARGFVEQVVEVGPTPHDPVITSDGLHTFVPCMGSDELVKVRLGDGVIVGRCRVGDGPSHVKADHRKKRIYAANSWDGTVTAVSEDGTVVAQADSGAWAHALVLTPDGASVWVANFLEDTVAVFDAETLERLAVLETEAYPHGLDISPDGKRAVVTGFASDHVRVFDVTTRTQIARIEVGRGGSHTGFIRGTSAAMVTCSVDDHLACIDLDSGKPTGRISFN
jgi:YVTN family beta-propeller protein